MKGVIGSVDKNSDTNVIICGEMLHSLKILPNSSIHLAIIGNIDIDSIYRIDDERYKNTLITVLDVINKKLTDGGRVAFILKEEIVSGITMSPLQTVLETGFNLKMHYRGTIIINRLDSYINKMAFGTVASCRSPYIMPIHSYLVIFSNGKSLDGNDKMSDITKDEYFHNMRSIWNAVEEVPFTETSSDISKNDNIGTSIAYRLVKSYTYKKNNVLLAFAGGIVPSITVAKMNRYIVHVDDDVRRCKELNVKLSQSRSVGAFCKKINYINTYAPEAIPNNF